MPRTRCFVRNCPNHADEGAGYHMVVTRCSAMNPAARGEPEEVFVCAPCMAAITGRNRGTRSDLLHFIHKLTENRGSNER